MFSKRIVTGLAIAALSAGGVATAAYAGHSSSNSAKPHSITKLDSPTGSGNIAQRAATVRPAQAQADEGQVHAGSVDEGQVENGTVDEGQVDDGTVDEGQVKDGTVDEGQVDDGTADDTSDDSADSSTDDSSTDDAVDEGQADDNTADDAVDVGNSGEKHAAKGNRHDSGASSDQNGSSDSGD